MGLREGPNGELVASYTDGNDPNQRIETFPIEEVAAKRVLDVGALTEGEPGVLNALAASSQFPALRPSRERGRRPCGRPLRQPVHVLVRKLLLQGGRPREGRRGARGARAGPRRRHPVRERPRGERAPKPPDDAGHPAVRDVLLPHHGAHRGGERVQHAGEQHHPAHPRVRGAEVGGHGQPRVRPDARLRVRELRGARPRDRPGGGHGRGLGVSTGPRRWRSRAWRSRCHGPTWALRWAWCWQCSP